MIIFFFSPYFTARPIAILQGLSDQKVCEGDIVQLEVKVSLENVEGVWMKDGQEVQHSDRVHIVIDKQSHMLLIEDMTKEDAGNYSFAIPALGLSTSGHVSVYSECYLHSFKFILSSEVENFKEKTF
jgi:titin